MASETDLVLDAHLYSLLSRPPKDSPLVLEQRGTLPTAIPCVISATLALTLKFDSLSKYAPLQKRFSELVAQLQQLTLRPRLRLIHSTACSVLTQQPLTYALIISHPYQNDTLRHQHALVSTLAQTPLQHINRLERFAKSVSLLLTALHSAQESIKNLREEYQSHMSALRVQSVSMFHEHAQVLQSLSEYGKLYTQLTVNEHRATRRQAMCNFFSFVPTVDNALRTSWNIPILEPISRMMDSVHSEAQTAQQDAQHVLECKKRQRTRNKQLLDDLASCQQSIARVSRDIAACDEDLTKVTEASQSLQAIGVTALRSISAWRSIAHACERLAGGDLSRLIDITCSCGVEAQSSAPDSGEDHAIPTVDASSGSGKWVMQSAVKRKFVTYYSQWAALADACQECLQHVVQEPDTVAKISFEGMKSEDVDDMRDRDLSNASVVTPEQDAAIENEASVNADGANAE